jgi:hypothetical protein
VGRQLGSYAFTPPDGTTDVAREGQNFRGRALAIVVGIIGKRRLGKQLGKTVNRKRNP